MKYRFVGLVVIGLFVLFGCNTAQATGSRNTYNGPNVDNTANKSAEAIANEDVVERGMGQVSNLPVFIRFYNNVRAGKQDGIRIVRYTDEGDPIFIDLDFDGKVIQYTFDNSQDKFGGTGKGRTTAACTGVSAQQVVNGTSYTVTGCKDTNIPSEILFISASK